MLLSVAFAVADYCFSYQTLLVAAATAVATAFVFPQNNISYCLSLSYIEIYKEKCYDLLNESMQLELRYVETIAAIATAIVTELTTVSAAASASLAVTTTANKCSCL